MTASICSCVQFGNGFAGQLSVEYFCNNGVTGYSSMYDLGHIRPSLTILPLIRMSSGIVVSFLIASFVATSISFCITAVTDSYCCWMLWFDSLHCFERTCAIVSANDAEDLSFCSSIIFGYLWILVAWFLLIV